MKKVDVEETAVDEDGNQVDAEIVTDEEEANEADEKQEKTIYYVTDEEQQGQYIQMFKVMGWML